jgi:pSer/pThr/pTyr-binding forkhead associated (FHA) protein
VTLGRASTNQIVIKDDRCSRYHAEIFLAQGRWTIRDLDSRNGTNVGGKLIRGDHPLSPGDLIRIANCQMVFVHDLASAFEDSSSKFAMADLSEDTVTEPAWSPKPPTRKTSNCTSQLASRTGAARRSFSRQKKGRPRLLI